MRKQISERIQQIRKRINNCSGQAMIVVLCLLAVFVALSFSILYVSAQMSAGMQQSIGNEQCHQQALSFSDVIKHEITQGDASSDLRTFVNSFIEDEFYAEDTDWYFETDNEAEGYEQMQLILNKINEDETEVNWSNDPVSRYRLDITVWVKRETENGTILNGGKVTTSYQQVVSWSYFDNMVYSVREMEEDVENVRRLRLTKIDQTGTDEYDNYGFTYIGTDEFLTNQETVITLQQAISENGFIGNKEIFINLPNTISSAMYTFTDAGRSE